MEIRFSGTAPTNCPFSEWQMNDYGAWVGRWRTERWKYSEKGKNGPCATLTAANPTCTGLDWTECSAVRSGRRTVWAMTNLWIAVQWLINYTKMILDIVQCLTQSTFYISGVRTVGFTRVQFFSQYLHFGKLIRQINELHSNLYYSSFGIP